MFSFKTSSRKPAMIFYHRLDSRKEKERKEKPTEIHSSFVNLFGGGAVAAAAARFIRMEKLSFWILVQLVWCVRNTKCRL